MFCNKNYQKKFDGNLKKQFFKTYKLPNYDINKFILLLRKILCSYKYMDGQKKFSETSLSKRRFYSHLNTENITDADYTHAEKVCKDFKIKHIEKYYDLHIQSDTLLLADVFDSFRSMCLEIYELNTSLFLASPGLA